MRRPPAVPGRLETADPGIEAAPGLADLAVAETARPQPALDLALRLLAVDVVERLGVDLGRVLVGVGGLRLHRRQEEERSRRGEVPRRQEVAAELDRRRARQLAQGQGGGGVEGPAARPEVLVDRVPGERVAEAVESRVGVGLLDQLGEHGRRERAAQLLDAGTGHPGQDVVAEAVAENGRRAKDLRLAGEEAVDAVEDDVADRLRQAAGDHPVPARVTGGLEHLLDDVGVALAPFQEGQRGRPKPLAADRGADHRPGPGRVERLEGDRLDQPRLLPAPDQGPQGMAAGEILGPAGADQEEADRPLHPRQVVEELAG